MKQTGLELVENDKGVALLYGDFAGYKRCEVLVQTLANNDLVCEITVGFPEQGVWTDLESDYQKLKDMLTKKYGKPDTSKEEFVNMPNYMKSVSDGNMYGVWYNHCAYSSTFKTTKGEILLYINKGTQPVSGKVNLRYKDKVNSQILEKIAIDDL